MHGPLAMNRVFELRRGTHAIAEFQASVQLFQAVSAAAFTRVSEKLRQIAAEFNLPASVPIQIFQLSASGQPAPQMAGIGYQRFAENGEVTMAILCDADSIIVTIRDYQGWQQTQQTLLRIFEHVLPEYMSEVPAAQSVRLQYVNEFRAINENTVDAADIYNAESQWIAPFVLSANEDWHCNVGRYIRFSEDRRDLVNVNSSAMRKADEPGQKTRLYVSTMIMAGCFYNIPNHSPLILDPAHLRDQLSDALNSAHSLEKQVLAETLAASYLEAVGAIDVN